MKNSLAPSITPSRAPMEPRKALGWFAVAAMIFLANPGATTGTVMPLVVNALVQHGGVGVGTAMACAAWQMAGMGLAMVATSLVITRLSLRFAAAVALITVCLGNIFSANVSSILALDATRLMTGIGSGVAYAISMALIANSPNASRNFGLSIACNQVGAIVLLTFLPGVIDKAGLSGAMIALAVFVAPSAALILWLPRGIDRTTDIAGAIDRLTARWSAIRGLAAVFLLSGSFGACWPLIGQIAVARHASESSIGLGFALAGYGGIMGGLASAWLAPRMNESLMLALGSLGFTLALLLQIAPVYEFSVAALALFFFTTFNIPNFLAFVARIDKSGRLAIVMTALMQLGMAAGQALVSLVESNAGLSRIIVGGAMISALAWLIISVRPAKSPPAVAQRLE